MTDKQIIIDACDKCDVEPPALKFKCPTCEHNKENKQILIDGVDVSGCGYIIPPHKQCPNKPMPYAKETSCFACKENNTKLNFCKNNPNCYYKQLKNKEQECERLKWYMQEIRNQELLYLDIEWDEYETHCIDTEYSNIINLVEEALEERSPEDCRYER